jgi:tetraacyldisaccharide 4'-kinase
LREPPQSVKRADLVVVSKCPEYMSIEREFEIMKIMSRWIRSHHIFFTHISYLQPEGVFSAVFEPIWLENIRKEDEILLITGIANPTPLIEKIKFFSDKVSILSFADHHAFTKKDMQKIQSELSAMTSDNPLIICTEKDAARLRTNPHFPNELKSRIFYIPIAVSFTSDIEASQFTKTISHYIANLHSS